MGFFGVAARRQNAYPTLAAKMAASQCKMHAPQFRVSLSVDWPYFADIDKTIHRTNRLLITQDIERHSSIVALAGQDVLCEFCRHLRVAVDAQIGYLGRTYR